MTSELVAHQTPTAPNDPSPTAPSAPHPTPQPEPRTRQVALGVGGIAFAAVLLPVALIPHPGLDLPSDRPVADPQAVINFFGAHRSLELYQTVMHALAGLALLIFLVALADRVGQVASTRSVVPRLTASAGAAAAAVMITTMAIAAGTVQRTGMVDGGTQYWLYDLAWGVHVQVLFLIPVALVPACLLLRRHRGLPGALCWTGLVVALLAAVAMVIPIVPGLGAAAGGLAYPAFFALIVWVLAVGVVALARGLRDPRG